MRAAVAAGALVTPASETYASCEQPDCTRRAGDLAVLTPFGTPVLCDEHANALASERKYPEWLQVALRYGPAVHHAARVGWLSAVQAVGGIESFIVAADAACPLRVVPEA